MLLVQREHVVGLVVGEGGQEGVEGGGGAEDRILLIISSWINDSRELLETCGLCVGCCVFCGTEVKVSGSGVFLVLILLNVSFTLSSSKR